MNSLRWRVFIFVALFQLAHSSTQGQLPGFPGADGAGQFASGGRGGIVYHVTKLNAELNDPQRNSPGTFLYGINDANFPANTPRTIVFDVAGVIHLGMADTTNWTSNGNAWDSQSRQSISGTNLTIAGQSAPGPVIIMGGTLKPSGSNIVIRNITIAAGYGVKNFWEPPPKTPPSPGAIPTSFVMDAIDVSGKTIMIDHVDALFCTDEAISCNERANNLTVQYCNCSLAQNYNGHAYGHLLQPDTNFKISLLNNLDAHMDNRLPRVGSEVGVGSLNDFRNNVFYNWIGVSGFAGYTGAFQTPSQYSKNNFLHNFYLAGNGGDTSGGGTAAGGTGIFYGYQSFGVPVGPVYTAVYAAGNAQDTNKDGDPNDVLPADAGYADSVIQASAYDINIGVTLSARAAFTNVLSYVGSRWWERDYDIALGNTNAIDRIDERVIHDVITGQGKIQAWADNPFDTNDLEGVEWRSLWALRMDTNGAAPFNHPDGWDTDQDGMSDTWEVEHDLNPNVASNNNDFDGDGYTDLEEYLNDLATWPAPGQIVFTGGTNNRYAQIHNWRVYGTNVNISGLGIQQTFSPWQPSCYDVAVVSNATVIVDAVGQHAGTLRLQEGAALNITNGWLKVTDTIEIGISSVATLNLSGGLLRVGTLDKGVSSSFNFTGGTLSADTIGFDLLNQGGTISPGISPGTTHVIGNLSLESGALAMELGSTGLGESDQIGVDGSLTLGGVLNITDRPGFGVGTYTLLTYGGTIDGSLAIGTKPDGYVCTVDTNTPGQVLLVVDHPQIVTPPTINSVELLNDDIVIGAAGPTNGFVYVLGATNVSLPLYLWTPLLTNQFDGSGQLVLTNALDGKPEFYYRLQLP